VPWLGRLDPDARKVDLHDQPSDGETESQAAFAARLWRTARAPRIEFEGALFKGGSNYGESDLVVERPQPFDTNESRFDFSFVL
jgi:hypothetical protein